MTAIKVYLDEDVHTYIAQALRLRGWEALTTEEAGQRGADDPEQILFATRQGYTILTYNINDYPRLHYDMVNRGDTHAGIIGGSHQRATRLSQQLGIRAYPKISSSSLVRRAGQIPRSATPSLPPLVKGLTDAERLAGGFLLSDTP